MEETESRYCASTSTDPSWKANKIFFLFMELKGVGGLTILVRKGCPSKEGTLTNSSKALPSVSGNLFYFSVCFLCHSLKKKKICAN